MLADRWEISQSFLDAWDNMAIAVSSVSMPGVLGSRMMDRSERTIAGLPVRINNADGMVAELLCGATPVCVLVLTGKSPSFLPEGAAKIRSGE